MKYRYLIIVIIIFLSENFYSQVNDLSFDSGWKSKSILAGGILPNDYGDYGGTLNLDYKIILRGSQIELQIRLKNYDPRFAYRYPPMNGEINKSAGSWSKLNMTENQYISEINDNYIANEFLVSISFETNNKKYSISTEGGSHHWKNKFVINQIYKISFNSINGIIDKFIDDFDSGITETLTILCDTQTTNSIVINNKIQSFLKTKDRAHENEKPNNDKTIENEFNTNSKNKSEAINEKQMEFWTEIQKAESQQNEDFWNNDNNKNNNSKDFWIEDTNNENEKDSISDNNLERFLRNIPKDQIHIKRFKFVDERDGQEYKAVTFAYKRNKVTWMAENLNYKINGSDSYNDQERYRTEFGLMYQHDILKDVCPDGWRIPDQEDWNDVAVYDRDGMKDEFFLGYNSAWFKSNNTLNFKAGGYGFLGNWKNAEPYHDIKKKTRFWGTENEKGDRYFVEVESKWRTGYLNKKKMTEDKEYFYCRCIKI